VFFLRAGHPRFIKVRFSCVGTVIICVLNFSMLGLFMVYYSRLVYTGPTHRAHFSAHPGGPHKLSGTSLVLRVAAINTGRSIDQNA
jgi:hypothetical protein